MVSYQVHIYEDKLEKACTETAEGLEAQLASVSKSIAQRANSLSGGFRTMETTRWETGERVGGTKPDYGSSAKPRGKKSKGPVGIVYTNNYSARKDNLENNTLLKARG